MDFCPEDGSKWESQPFQGTICCKGLQTGCRSKFWGDFCPNSYTFVSLRLLLTVAAPNHWPVHSFDFIAAYLNSSIDKEVWVKLPNGVTLLPGHAFLHKKALYGTQQAACCWWLHLWEILDKLGYSLSQYDNSLYALRHKTRRGIVWIHVDNSVVASSSTDLL